MDTQTWLYDIGLALGILISLATLFKIFIFNPLNKLINTTVDPQKQSIEALQKSIEALQKAIDRLAESSKAQHDSIEHRLNEHDQHLVRHDEQLHTLFNEKDERHG